MPSLLEAIDRKYGTDSEGFEIDLPIAIYVPKKSPRNCIPSLLVLNDCDIESAGDDQELKSKCQGVEELDLAQNKLSQWSEIFCILKHMPRVKFVNLSFNSLQDELSINENPNFSYLKNLVLNGTHVEWPSVQKLLEILPNLEELHLSLNEYSKVNLGEQKHEGVRKLHFTGNPVSSWVEICKLGVVFPSLEALVLADCPLESLEPDGYGTSHCCFPHLKCLNVNSTLLRTWSDVDRLSKFPALHCLRIQACPLMEDYTEYERRQLLIARLPNVQTMNGGGVIGGEEREDAERAFIRFYMEKAEEDRPERYNELVEIHGKLDPLIHVDLSPEKKVNVIISYKEQQQEYSFSVYQTVQELKQKLDTITRIPANKMRLFYVDQVMREIQGPEEMRFPQKQLYSYNISSGDEIIVDSKV